MDLQDTSLTLVALFALGGLVAWASAAFALRRRMRRERAVAGWRRVEATIIDAEVIVLRTADGKQYAPQVRFIYCVAAREFIGEQLRLGARELRMQSREAAELALQRYRTGDRALAYCDPRDPSAAVLETEPAGPDFGTLFLLGLAMMALAAFLLRGA